MTEANSLNESTHSRRFPVWLIVLLTILVTALVTVGVIRYYFWPKPFEQVELSAKEQKKLDQKLARLIPGYEPDTASVQGQQDANTSLEPEKYNEEGASREVKFSEKEINALIAKNTDLGDKLAVDLSNDLVSARLLFDADPDMPFIGGKTIRVATGMTLSYENNKPVAIIRGVKIMGVPVPSAWLGGLKNVDLISQFGDAGGFWQAFVEGIEHLQVQDGKLAVQLAE